jgi:hypothetical protein
MIEHQLRFVEGSLRMLVPEHFEPVFAPHAVVARGALQVRRNEPRFCPTCDKARTD